MSIFTWFKTAFGQGGLNNPDRGAQSSEPPPESDNINLNDERAMQLSTVFACVRLIVTSGGTLPLGFYRRSEGGREELPERHFLPQLLKYQPNQYMTGKEFRQAMLAQRVLWGNGYALKGYSGSRLTSLTPLKPGAMEVIKGLDGPIYRYGTPTGIREYTKNDIFHLKGWSVDGVTGLSTLGYARQTMGSAYQADQTAKNSIGGRANAVLSLPDYPTDAQMARIRELYGAGKRMDAYRSDGGMMILPGGMKYEAMGMPPDDLQLLESRQFSVPEICRFFGVPSVMIDGQAGSTAAWPASYEQQVLSFLTFTLKGYLEEWEDAIRNSLLTGADRMNLVVEHNVEGLLRTDSAARSTFYSTALQNGWMTVNEVREKENLPKSEDPGADQLHAQTNLAPLGQLGGKNEADEGDSQAAEADAGSESEMEEEEPGVPEEV